MIIGKSVTVTVDRPMGSFHPEHKDLYYPINYGYIKNIFANDGEEQDAYIIGVNEPVSNFTGKVVAVIKRFNDNEDKWVVAPSDFDATKEYIIEKTNFLEQFFNIEIIME